MDLEPFILRAFEKTAFTPVDTGPEKPRAERKGLVIPQAVLRKAAEEGFRELAFFFRESHLALLADRLTSGDSSENDRMVINLLLKNAVTASGGNLALCQDTGTAVVYGWKDEGVFSGSWDREALEAGVESAWKNNFLRASQIAPASFFDEYNTGNNLPVQIRLEAAPGGKQGPAYRFLFIAKGGGSSNKTSLFSMTKALLEEKAFEAFLEEKIRSLGTAACPPYRFTAVIGGTSPEFNLEVQKLASAEALDTVPYFAGKEGPEAGAMIYRDRYWENKAMEIGRKTGLGAQFGGTCFLLDARILRLPRHAASCTVSIGVSCTAHRNIFAYINAEGLFIERLVHDPLSFLRNRGISPAPLDSAGAVRKIDLEKPIQELCRDLSALKTGDRLLLSGKLLVARDAAHQKWRSLLTGGTLPAYLFQHPVYYAGPAGTPPGKITGSLGPTTAGRMDSYAEDFMSRGASLITVAKGNRSPLWVEACKKYGGFYLGTAGGAAALFAEKNITASEIIDYPELGMEAVRLITVKDLPAFIVIDDKGRDLYAL
ncbi:MAG: FumA C-terminus/TtdB family hydratase beta subunit [Treponema sp.]|nr:FumA C-terminus/TtdB family hydratase beta subunit [Treponema sp.]